MVLDTASLPKPSRPLFCELCGRPLRYFTGPYGYLWLQCPKWPKKGEHWWSEPTSVWHSSVAVTKDEFPVKYDRLTGTRL